MVPMVVVVTMVTAITMVMMIAVKVAEKIWMVVVMMVKIELQ